MILLQVATAGATLLLAAGMWVIRVPLLTSISSFLDQQVTLLYIVLTMLLTQEG